MTVSHARQINQAVHTLKEHSQYNDSHSETLEFDPSPKNALGIRAHTISKLFTQQVQQRVANIEYLHALGYVREQFIAARDVLNTEGKKKYEYHIKTTLAEIPRQFSGLKAHHLDVTTHVMDIPFRRSTQKDREEITHALCLVTDYILNYRYSGLNERYREYASTITANMDTEHLPPMIASLIINEITALVNDAVSSGIFAYKNTGLTCEEYSRHEQSEECEQEETLIHFYKSPEMDFPAAGIAQQSLWYGLNDELDNFIISLSSGLHHASGQ